MMLHVHQPRRGRPPKFSDAQIVKCMIYQVFYRIKSLRELEWRLRYDSHARTWIGLSEVPDHSTLSRRVTTIEKSSYELLFHEILHRLNPQTCITYWDSTPLRASRFDQEAQKGKGTRLGWYVGYKLHAIVSEDLLPLVWRVTPANIHDSQTGSMLGELTLFSVFRLLGDGAYDVRRLFERAAEYNIRLVTAVNVRNAQSLTSVRDPLRQQNIRYIKFGPGKKLLKKRAAIERLFAVLKMRYHLENPQMYGQRRYTRHVRWVLFTYLCDRLAEKQAGIQTVQAPWNR
jgi:hypothetical protein